MDGHRITVKMAAEPTATELDLLCKYMESMPVDEVLAGLKFAKNRWDAKDSGALRPGRKSIVGREVHSVTSEQAVWRLKNWKLMVSNYRRRGYSYPTIMRIKNVLKEKASDGTGVQK